MRKTQGEEGDGRILLGDNTGGEPVILRPSVFLFVEVWISNGLLYI